MPRCPNCSAERADEYCGECGQRRIFALHYVSFMYLITAAAGASRAIGVPTEAAAMSAFAFIVPYLILALKRVYLEANGSIVLQAAALAILTLAVHAFASLMAIRLTLALV